MGEIYDFDNDNCNPELLIENEIKRQESFLKESIWYHGITGRIDAEHRISNNGEFLVRFSPENESKFVVSTKWNGKFIHTIIKTEIDAENNQLVYYINDKFKFVSVYELITFHKENQYPMSEKSGAVLFKAIDPNNIKNNGFQSLHRESKFRKSTNMFRKHTEKRGIPRSGSETYLTNQRLSDKFPDVNKSLTNLSAHDYDAPNKPKKPSFKLLNSKHLLLKLRPSNIKIRNKKLYKDSADYSDYTQVKDTDDAIMREKMRRGFSLENRSPSLFGLNTLKKEKAKKKLSIDSSIYLMSNKTDNAFFRQSDEMDAYVTPRISDNTYVTPRFNDNAYLQIDTDDRDSTRTLTANTPVVSSSNFDTYGFDKLNSPIVDMHPKSMTPKSLGLTGFVNLALFSHQIPCCGPVESTFDKVAINKVSTYLISFDNFHLVLCNHLLNELMRIFKEAAAPFHSWNVGYRWIFLPCSDRFQRDLTIRQTALSHFIMATIVSTISTEKRISLIFFWIKCANHLLTHTRDMIHFTAVFSALFSDQILSLRVWKIVYRQDPLAKDRMMSLKEAIKNGCLKRTDIDQCIPDLVQLGNVFSGNEDDLDVASKISIDIATWSNQAFLSPSTWLIKMMNELDSKSVIPYFREMVQTETLLCMIFGQRSISFNDMTPLFDKVSDCIRMMVKTINDKHI